ncbi:MAG TPA: malate/lactate/ureidoglycolate dehydrogenase [Geminicoccaceae bacterium]|nr:malate/lactate/ureidoglycolate dehydrogenase [Geminicoccaceae bacterium]
MRRFSRDGLLELVRAFCRATGSEGDEPELVARHLVEANLAGHDSHGIGMLPDYMRGIEGGMLVPNRHAEVLADFGAVLVLDGGRGYGQVIADEAMRLGIAKARKQGAAVVGLRNSAHVGRVGHWAERCAAKGFASVHFVNVIDRVPLVATFGGSDARLGTNPFCAGLPGGGGGEPAALLDMATSRIAFGKVRVAMNKGVPVPPGSLIDGEGRPTDDPNIMFPAPRGALMAFGEHKGSGLAIVCELFAGALTGGATLQPGTPRMGGILNNMLSVIIDPGALGERGAIAAEVEALKRWVKDSPPAPGFDEVLVPGEPEQRNRAERSANGIPVDDGTWGGIVGVGESIGVDAGAVAGPPVG